MAQKAKFSSDWFHKKLFRRNRRYFYLLIKLWTIDLKGSLTSRETKLALKGGRFACIKTIRKGGNGVEVGTWRGDFSQSLLQMLKPARLSLIDPWPVDDPKTSKKLLPRDHNGDLQGLNTDEAPAESLMNEVYRSVKRRFEHLEEVYILRATSEEASLTFEDRSLDWVYIDGSHYYEDVALDLNLWQKKLRTGGVLFGDDYYWRSPESEYSVKRAVDEFVSLNSPKSWAVFRGQYLIFI